MNLQPMRHKPVKLHQSQVHKTDAPSASVSYFFLTFSDCLYITYVCMLLQSFLITSILFILLCLSLHTIMIFFPSPFCVNYFMSSLNIFLFAPVSTFITLQMPNESEWERWKDMENYGYLHCINISTCWVLGVLYICAVIITKWLGDIKNMKNMEVLLRCRRKKRNMPWDKFTMMLCNAVNVTLYGWNYYGMGGWRGSLTHFHVVFRLSWMNFHHDLFFLDI